MNLHGAANPNEPEETHHDSTAEEVANEGYHLLKSVFRHCYHLGQRFFIF